MMITKKSSLLIVSALMLAFVAKANINYNGTKLSTNDKFTRTECGTAYKDVLKEVSGLACSRQTPGYLWAHGDENTGEDKKIVAIKPDGSLVMTLNINGDPGRDDWEDIATGVYNGKNYIFIGTIGDNDLAYKDSYYIYYFEEPAITSGTQTVSVNYIRFGYPDNKAHNTETLMYDNIEHAFYIADKVEGGACHLYTLPFQTNYGTYTQKLTEVCALGNGNTFDLATGGDISPDGKWMAIKNKEYILLWERQGSESLTETAKRLPEVVTAYKEEKQGESLAWENSSIFYTTSDQKKDVPMYKYVRASDPSSATVTDITIDGKPLADFAATQLTYNVELAYGTETTPVVKATTGDEASVKITQATTLPGQATIVCTSKDGSKSVTYTINFSVSATPSSDSQLRSLSINGTAVADFQPNQLNYSMVIAYVDALPVVTAEANDEHATITITNVSSVGKTPSNATVVVTAQDGVHSTTYTISFTRADAIKQLYEIIMSNKYSAYIDALEPNYIRAYYLEGEALPTISSYKVSEGASLRQEGNTVTLIGADEGTTTYTLVTEAVKPVEFTTEEIIFDGTETWIKGGYGFDSTKKWKFSKTDTDYSREIAGKTH
ncbi:MAG: cadherin-like beta sandwich domain-containing protein, partial [Paludibacteraceae bacterium]|nr:cadherin-like beta sandwich domain-containing protein [Paludibacteraceae bacterium]